MKKNRAYVLGIDGGGTKAVVCAADKRSGKFRIFQKFESGALNINGQTKEQLKETISEIEHRLGCFNLKVDECTGVGIGSAGITNPDASGILRREFERHGFSCPVHIFGDHETALAAAFPEYHGIVLIAGTGSICYGRNREGREFRSGGYGYLIDDGGGAYAIGRDMLLAVVKAEDGRGKPTILKSLILEKRNLQSIEELIGSIYRSENPKSRIASLAPLIENAVTVKDEAALAIERHHAEALVDLAVSVYRQLPCETNIACSGNVLMNNSRIQRFVEYGLKKYDDSLHIEFDSHEAAEGAIRLWELEKKCEI